MITKFNHQDAVDIAKKLYNEKYQKAKFVIASGSIIRGNGSLFSDLDLIIIYPKLKAAYRESFIFDNMPIEAFVHDYETIQAFIIDDYNQSHIAIIDMIASGLTIPFETDLSFNLKKYAKKFLIKRAKKLKTNELETLRYNISDLIDDLKGERPLEEIKAILYQLYHKICELALRQQKEFFSLGKYLPRYMKKTAPDIFEKLEYIMQEVHSNNFSNEHIKCLETILEELGGYLFDGYKQQAPKNKRAKALWLKD